MAFANLEKAFDRVPGVILDVHGEKPLGNDAG